MGKFSSSWKKQWRFDLGDTGKRSRSIHFCNTDCFGTHRTWRLVLPSSCNTDFANTTTKLTSRGCSSAWARPRQSADGDLNASSSCSQHRPFFVKRLRNAQQQQQQLQHQLQSQHSQQQQHNGCSWCCCYCCCSSSFSAMGAPSSQVSPEADGGPSCSSTFREPRRQSFLGVDCGHQPRCKRRTSICPLESSRNYRIPVHRQCGNCFSAQSKCQRSHGCLGRSSLN